MQQRVEQDLDLDQDHQQEQIKQEQQRKNNKQTKKKQQHGSDSKMRDTQEQNMNHRIAIIERNHKNNENTMY